VTGLSLRSWSTAHAGCASAGGSDRLTGRSGSAA
jgi:hypothetical protein